MSSDASGMPIVASDRDLLRRFEPVVRFTKGEQFYPWDVERYIRSCSLWERSPDGHEELLEREDELAVEKLVRPRPAAFGTVQFLRFVEPPSLRGAASALAEQTLMRRKTGDMFRTGQGRLARGGFLPRIVDALFSVSLLLRGRVPAATAAAAKMNYQALQKEREEYVYYGRVVRQDGWTTLQYWFFFTYNNWRSGFHGVNDHEGDWENILVYLYEQDGWLIPEWAAYGSHDFYGDDLRRRWDDQEELKLVDGHPVVYAGAGSHACYFRSGEYQAEVSLPLPKWYYAISRAWQKLWGEILGMGGVRSGNPFRIPFVDFARGDGLSIGPGQGREWTAEVIDEATPWVSQYWGLWGLFARDPISGENAPAGPMYNRDGTPRIAWYDPLGYAGLDKVPPPPEELRLLEEKCTAINRRQVELEVEIALKASELQMLGVEMKSMEGNPHLAKKYASMKEKLSQITTEVREMRRERVESGALLQGLRQRGQRLKEGRKDDPHGHIRRLLVPASNHRMRFGVLAETWAAVSLSLLLLGVAALAYFAPHYLWTGLGILMISFVVIESFLRGTFIQTISSITSLLAVIVTLILIIRFWLEILLAGLVILSVFLLVQKVRELRD